MKRKLWLIVFFSFLCLVLTITGTYALFETNGFGIVELPISKWIIKLNEYDIVNGDSTDMVINNVTYSDNNNVEDNYIAPGRTGYFDIILDPTGTEVAVRYDITFDLSSLDYPDNIIFTMTADAAGPIVQTGPDTYSGIVSLDEIANHSNISLHLVIDWLDINDDDHNESDSAYGLNKDMEIGLPISFKLSQYLGEEINEYIPTEE